MFTLVTTEDNCIQIEYTLVSSAGKEVTAGCPIGWQRTPDGSRCFGLLFDRRNWQDARRACQMYKADLASFHRRYALSKFHVSNHFILRSFKDDLFLKPISPPFLVAIPQND